ncbi:MAG: LacI family DNA-binding transcriptional regulator [Actinomycetes bacterium]
MRAAGRASLRDVASLAGVSVKTVSNVVNHYEHVSPAMRERVQRALDSLDYRPNLSARNLRGGRSGLIALAVPELDAPYFAEVSRHVVRAAEQRGWTVLIDQTDGLPERERLVIAGIRAHFIDGVIFSPLASGPKELAARSDATPMVLLGERVSGGTVDHVGIDNVAAARAAVAHLLDLGRVRVAAIGKQRRRTAVTARLRERGYTRALEAAGMAVEPALVRGAESYHRADGASAMADLLALPEPPDAVFCFNDLLALGALRTLLQHGVRVPEDVALIGFDDIEESRYTTPTLSTVRPDKASIADRAVELLAARIDGAGPASPRGVVEPFELMPRESTLGATRPPDRTAGVVGRAGLSGPRGARPSR